MKEFHPLSNSIEEFELLDEESADFLGIVSSLKKIGLLESITLFEGKILDGRNRERACEKAGIIPTYEQFTGDDPYTFVIARNFNRRHLTSPQKRKVIARLLKEKPQASNREIAVMVKVDDHTVAKVRNEEDSAQNAEIPQNAHLPIERAKIAVRENPSLSNRALSKLAGVADHTVAKARTLLIASKEIPSTVKSSTKPSKLKWTPEEEAKNEECLAIINAPSKFPVDAPIPQTLAPNEGHLRGAIIWLRKHEGEIASFKEKELHTMLLNINGVQAYKLNYHNFARPDGELNERIIDWAQDLWLRKERQFTRLELLRKLHPPRTPKAEEPLAQKAKRSFEDRFKTFWMLIEDSLGQLFKPNESSQVIKRFNEEAKQFFSNASGENRGAAVVADAQKSIGPGDS